MKAPVELSIQSDPVYLAGARELIAALCRRVGFQDEACGQVALAVDEALANVIRHGYDRRTDGPIRVLVWPESEPGVGGIRIVIEDEAKQVDPASIKSRDLDDVRPGGLGVYIMKRVMDGVAHEKREGGVGMRLTMHRAASSDAGVGGSGAEANDG
ncbi:MAG: ATP-binding protein [Planctomycetota bacterium]